MENHRKIERVGLEAVPAHLKTVSAWGYIKIQTAVNVNAGNMLIPALAVLQGGMGFYTAVWTTLAGALIAFVFVSLMSVPGSRDGVPGQYAIRSMLGSNGSMLFSSPVRTVTSLYWFSVQAIGGAYLLKSVLGRLGIELPLILISTFIALIMVIIAIIGFQAMKTFASYFTPVLLLGIAAMFFTYIETESYPQQAPEADPGTMIFYASLAFVQYVSGVSAAADMTRYAKTSWHGGMGLFIGNGTGYVLTAVLGAWTASVAGEWNAFLVTSEMTSHPLLLFIIIIAAVGSMLIINVNNAYTGGFSLLNTVPRLGRIRAAVIFGLLGITLSSLPAVTDHAEAFISGLGILVIPLSGIITAEFLFIQKMKLRGITEKVNLDALIVLIAGSIGYYSMPADSAPGFLIFFLSLISYIILAKWKGRF